MSLKAVRMYSEASHPTFTFHHTVLPAGEGAIRPANTPIRPNPPSPVSDLNELLRYKTYTVTTDTAREAQP